MGSVTAIQTVGLCSIPGRRRLDFVHVDPFRDPPSTKRRHDSSRIKSGFVGMQNDSQGIVEPSVIFMIN